MRICANCGAEIPEGYKFCAKCGTPVPAEEPAVKAEETTDNAKETAVNTEETVDKTKTSAYKTEEPAAETGKPMDRQEEPAENTEETAAATEEPADNADSDKKDKGEHKPVMRWYSFIIYVDLFLAAVIYLILAALCATGYLYINNRTTVYTTYPGMQALNIIMAAFYVIMAVMAIVIRQRLAHCRKNGPRLYIRWLWAALIGWVSYEAIDCMIAGRFTIYLSAFPIQQFAIYAGVPVLIMILYILFNMFYFHRRKCKALFVE